MTIDRATVLLLEDDPVYARMVDAWLSAGRERPASIIRAASLAEGLRHLADDPSIALICLDLGLPDSEGLNTFLAVRDRAPDTAVIVLTGRDDDGLARQAVEQGAQDYIVKGSTCEKELNRAASHAVTRKQGERALRRMARQQAAVAALGQRALAGLDLPALLQEAVNVVAETLDARTAEVFESQGEAEGLLLRAAAGWPEGLVGKVDLGPGAASDAGAAIARGESLVYSGLDNETRFMAAPALSEQGLGSGACVVIRGETRPFGVLAAHDGARRLFPPEDVHFLELVANVLGAAIGRDQVEEVFRVSEAGYRHILDTASEGICALNGQGEVTYVNRRAAEMLRYDATDQIVGHLVEEFLFEEDREATARVFRSGNQGPQNQVDFRFRCRDGAELWVLASLSPILDQDGQFAGALTMFTDVTGRRRAERALQESEARYRRIVETATEGIWVASGDGRTEYVNRVMAEMLGYTVGEMIGRSLFDFVFEDDRRDLRQQFVQRLQGVREPLEIRLRRKGGGEIWVTASTSPIQGDGRQNEGLLAMCTDITARRRAAAERARLSSAVEQAAEAIMMTRRDGTIVYVNPAFQRLTGYPSTEVLGRTPRLLRSESQDPRVYKDLWETILGGRVWRGEVTNRRKNGEIYTWEETITPVRDESGEITEFISFGQDISARRDLEARLRQSQKMEAIGRLAGGVAHDFNNLLTVITGYSERLLVGLGEDDPLRKGAEAIKRSADRAASLTQQLLAFSRRQIMAPRVLDLNQAVANMDKLLQRLIGEDVALVTDLAADLGRVKADPNQIEQVVMNLAVNSRDAMPDGGTLTIATANVMLTPELSDGQFEVQPGRYVMLAVSDTGFGMDAEVKSHLFEPFFTTKEQGKGTGLGLSTLYGIVKQSGGYVLVESEVGKGATFRIYLPRIDEAVDAPPAAAVPHKAPRGSETILLVEDEEAVRLLLRDILARYGYTVLVAGNGHEAIEICHAHQGPIHLVITDMVMPQMSGWEVADAVSMLRPKARFIYMSGYIEHVVVEQRVLESGVAFLGKPFTPETLARKVREVLGPGH